jgi:hypothetical protein
MPWEIRSIDGLSKATKQRHKRPSSLARPRPDPASNGLCSFDQSHFKQHGEKIT